MPPRDSASTWDRSQDRKILTCSRLTCREVIFKAEFDLPRTMPGSRGIWIWILCHGSDRDSNLAIGQENALLVMLHTTRKVQVDAENICSKRHYTRCFAVDPVAGAPAGNCGVPHHRCRSFCKI